MRTTTDPTQEVTMPEALALTPAQRFAAHRYAGTLPYDGPWNLRVTIGKAAQVESFQHSYTADEVVTASALLAAAALAADGHLTRGPVATVAAEFLAACDAGHGR